MRHITIPILVLFCFLLSAQTNIALLEIPARPISSDLTLSLSERNQQFILHKNLCLIPASVDDKTGYLILDTGAPDLVINQSPEGILQEGNTCTGEVLVGSAEVEKLEFANQTRYNIDAYSVDMSYMTLTENYDILGLLGYEQLKDFELLIDYHQQQVRFYPNKKNSLHQSHEPKLVLSYELQDHLPVLRLVHNGKSYRFGIDTGAATNLISPTLSQDLTFIDTDLEELRGLDGNIQKVEKKRMAAFSIAGQALPTMQYLVQDLKHLGNSSQAKIDGLLGAQFLKEWTCSINFEEQKIYVWQIEESL